MEYLGKIELKATGAQSPELQAEIIKAHPLAKKQVYKYAQKFVGKNDFFTAFNVWRFLRTKINYEKDQPGAQRIFLPSAFLHHRRGDCKSFATFAAAILTALYEQNLFQGRPGFRFTSYQSREIPSHIFNIIRFRNGDCILLDGCYSRFNSEKKPTFARNVFLK